jgi:hypothetical protein
MAVDEETDQAFAQLNALADMAAEQAEREAQKK